MRRFPHRIRYHPSSSTVEVEYHHLGQVWACSSTHHNWAADW